jgi:hypothetical protein
MTARAYEIPGHSRTRAVLLPAPRSRDDPADVLGARRTHDPGSRIDLRNRARAANIGDVNLILW